MLQKYSRVAQNQPLPPGEFEFSEFGDEEYLNDAKYREIKEQELTTSPLLDQENNFRSGSYKKCRICFCGLITICCILLFSSVAFHICEAIIGKNKVTLIKGDQKLELKSGTEDTGKEPKNYKLGNKNNFEMFIKLFSYIFIRLQL